MKQIFTLLFSLVIFNSFSQTYTSYTLQPDSNGIDAEIYDDSAGVNYGNSAEFIAFYWTRNGHDYEGKGLLKFDLSSIPSGLTLAAAKLSLYWDTLSSAGQSGTNAARLQRVTSPWTEYGVTWSTQPTVSATEYVTLPTSTATNQDYPDIDVTSMVDSMYNKPSTNYGFLMEEITKSTYRSLKFASSDHSKPSKWPKLVLVFRDSLNYTYVTNCGSLNVNFTNVSKGSPYYLWDFGDPSSGANNFIHTNGPTAENHTFSSNGTYTVKLYSLDSNDVKKDSIMKVIKIAPKPNLSLFGPASPVKLCDYDTGNFYFITATSNPAYKYLWTPTQYIQGSNKNSTVQINPRSNTNLKVLVTDTTTGCTNSDSIQFIFQNCIFVDDFTFTPPTCGQFSVNFKNQSKGVHHFTWYFDDPGSGASNVYSTTDSSTVVVHNFSNTGTFNVSLVAYDSLEKKKDSVSKQVLIATTSVAIIYNNDTTICAGQTVQLHAYGDGAFFWHPSPDLSSTTSANPTAKPLTNTKYYFENTKNGCKGIDSVIVTVTAIPSALFSFDTVCLGNENTLYALFPDPLATFSWKFGDGDTAEGSAVKHIYDSAKTYTVTMTAKSAGCDSTWSQKLIVPKLPVAIADAANYTANREKPGIQFKNKSQFAVTFLWDFGDGTQDTTYEPLHMYPDTGNYSVILRAIDAAGCYDEDTISIRIEEVFYYFIPSAFSPNKNGPAENEVFKVYGIGMKNYSMKIYDRWGQTVFDSDDPTKSWDGSFNGRALESATFIYYTKFKDPTGRRHIYRGVVTLLQ